MRARLLDWWRGLGVRRTTRRRALAWAGIDLALLLVGLVLFLSDTVLGHAGATIRDFALIVVNGWLLGQQVGAALEADR